jgi:hypothetical protein
MGGQLLEAATVAGALTGGAAAVVGAGYGVSKGLDALASTNQGGYTGPPATTNQPSSPQPSQPRP